MSSGSDADAQLEDETWDDWEGDESSAVKSLFTADAFPTVDQALAFDAQHHNFDLSQYRARVSRST
jgi:hypothetical protein